MHKGYMFSKYALDKDLKDVGGLWSRVDFRDYIITPKKIWLANKWFRLFPAAACQRDAQEKEMYKIGGRRQGMGNHI